jgi:hypothetical protein
MIYCIWVADPRLRGSVFFVKKLWGRLVFRYYKNIVANTKIFLSPISIRLLDL